MKKCIVAFCGIFLVAKQAMADADLFYMEAQGVGGYSTKAHKAVYYSNTEHDVMQKNSVGFDWLHKFSGSDGDWGSAALQTRIAYNDDHSFTPQVYNAYLKLKTMHGDVWGGHNRAAFGLASYWDTHSDLIGDLTMHGLSYDRDWGVGYYLDTEDGNVAASLTSGTGMNFRADGNWMAAMRGAYGVLSQDNYTIGASIMGGRVLETMGYKIMNKTPQDTWLIGVDAALNIDNFEHKIELDGGQFSHRNYYAALYRFGIKLDAEEEFRLDVQPTYIYRRQKEDWATAEEFSWQISADIKLALMHQYKHQDNDNMYIGQVYFYKPL